MHAMILDGRATAQDLSTRLQQETTLMSHHDVRPCLAVIRVGEDLASALYVQAKIVRAATLNIKSQHHALPAHVSASAVEDLIARLNADPHVHGILLQLPLPAHLDTQALLKKIDPRKDVDGLHPVNQGALYNGTRGLSPCTPLGCHLLLKRYNISVAGQHVVVVGRSRLVGKPAAQIMMAQDATVTLCHRYTRNLAALTRMADILITAVGQQGLISADMIKQDVVILDVGINKTPDGITGDVDFAECAGKAGAITPVPGGIGPMTVACLMYNTLIATSRQTGYIFQDISPDPLRQSPWA